MNILKLLSAEFSKIAANKAILFSVIAALLVPVVYGGILLSATWGPYDNLSNLPVAVVNNDRGALSGDQPINVGSDLVANMKEGKDLGWKFVDSAEAMKGIQRNDYYMAVIIPEDFSKRVTTVTGSNPKKLELEYIQNEGLNFLASKVTETAAQKMREKLADTITESYAANILGEVSDGFGEAADGSSQLAAGTDQLHKGTNELLNSVTSKQSDITKLANGTKDLKSGTELLLNTLNEKSGDINKLADGSKQLHEGTISLKDGSSQILAGLQKAESGSEELKNGVAERLVPGSRKVADGTGRLKNGSAELAAGAQKLVAGLEEYKKANPTVNIGPYYQQIIDGAKKISSGLDNLSTKSVALNEGAESVADGIANKVAPGTVALNDGLNQLVAGQTKLNQGAGKLESGAAQIADGNAKVDKGWNELIAGVTRLDDGAGKISDGNAKVDEGWKKLSQGATKLNDGAGKINDGSEKLSSGLKSGADKTGGMNDKDNINMLASPVKLKSKTVNGYEHYRDSTAPYVMTLALFVGILIMSLFIDFKRPPFISSFKWFTVKFLHLASLSVVQATLLLIVVLLLKVNVTNFGGLIFMTLIASLTFSAIVLFLTALGGNLGRFIALGFVIMQLSITGANLPIEMLPENYRSLSQFLPFTYSIAGFKSVISLNDFGAAVSNMSILLTFLIVSALLSFVVFIFKRDRAQSQDTGVTA
ncbi:YhgE/Pip domain-containing protein [Fictibacillus phosphorivorans]|uniref:YhgE/Pip domain-containing protein n=1 Tax=Fictibacillus phosphorivorans TaxID=1221500 RepID=UPI00203A696C|nr:YhgE/Pip domain-containing protein [Fictibacillus phosphorivorans]MCM3718715.1 YhgE/Pip domain-containing protein [Fictibacillus phosphorivorans]MCM3776338.1 YhgE/Pip domain-containing protein [Fictibacillus phosphorivorans]